jgi:hypothetical protein
VLKKIPLLAHVFFQEIVPTSITEDVAPILFCSHELVKQRACFGWFVDAFHARYRPKLRWLMREQLTHITRLQLTAFKITHHHSLEISTLDNLWPKCKWELFQLYFQLRWVTKQEGGDPLSSTQAPILPRPSTSGQLAHAHQSAKKAQFAVDCSRSHAPSVSFL